MKRFLICAFLMLFSLSIIGCTNAVNLATTPSVEDENDETASIVYHNSDYGFSLTLPETWKGYTVVNEEWEGYTLDGKGNVADESAETGSLILVRHPAWTEETKRQDIPIMVFTIDQWESLQDDEFHIGAAPMNPSELARSSKHVFALPARYNYAFPEGYEEVEDILESKPLGIEETK